LFLKIGSGKIEEFIPKIDPATGVISMSYELQVQTRQIFGEVRKNMIFCQKDIIFFPKRTRCCGKLINYKHEFPTWTSGSCLISRQIHVLRVLEKIRPLRSDVYFSGSNVLFSGSDAYFFERDIFFCQDRISFFQTK